MATVNRPAILNDLSSWIWHRKRARTLANLSGCLRRLRRRGGLRLKLISFITLIILTTVGALDYFIIKLMEKELSLKTFEVVETSLARIGEASRLVLLERTLENKINLDEMLQATHASRIEGLLDIGIFSTIKEDDGFHFSRLTGFKEEKAGPSRLDGELTKRLLAAKSEAIFRQGYFFADGARTVPAYRYIKPILTDYRGERHLLGAVVMAYSQEAIYGPIHSVIIISILITLVILALSIAVSCLLGARLTQPILTMAEAASEVTAGNLNVRLDVSTNDEIEDLGKRFNKMVRELRRKKIMQKFISASTIEMIEQGDMRHLKLGGEHQTMTLFFSDIRGFTAICEGRAPQEVVAIANFYLNLQAGIIQRWQGDIDKFVGDEVMALFAGKKSIERAINAGIEIQRTIAKENERRRKQGLATVEVGIGINHGEVVVGNIGSSARMDFTAMGSEVNLAAKLCAKAGPAEILIDRKIFLQTGSTFKACRLEEKEAEKRGLCNAAEIVLIKS